MGQDTTLRLSDWRAAVLETSGSAGYLPDGQVFVEQSRAAERAKSVHR